MLLDPQGRFLHANDAGERLLSSGTLVTGTAGRLSTSDRGVAAQMERAISIATDRERRRASRFMLTDRQSGSATDVDLLPIGPETSFNSFGRPAVLVRFSPAPTADRTQALMERFGLTAAERSLTLDLVAGKSLKETAEARGISVNTARCHLGRIFDKTGARRQAELVRLLLQPA